MSNRTIRRAAERAARKLALKELRINPPASATSPAQLLANQQNAQHSTGPTSKEGKSISALNNTRHGLAGENEPADFQVLPGEDQNAYNQKLAAFRAEWKPLTATEHDLVNRLTMHQWLRLRALRLQSTAFSRETGLVTDIKAFELYRRYETAHERGFNKAFADLARLRSLQQREQNGFESQRRKDEIRAFQIRRLQHQERMRQIKEATPAGGKIRRSESSLASPVPVPDHLASSAL